RARTQNGPLTVRLTGSTWSGAGLDAEASNGPVTLYVPDGYSANLETGTINGPLSSDVPLTITRLGRRSHIDTVLGSGGPRVRVVTTNGPVSIRRSWRAAAWDRDGRIAIPDRGRGPAIARGDARPGRCSAGAGSPTRPRCGGVGPFPAKRTAARSPVMNA